MWCDLGGDGGGGDRGRPVQSGHGRGKGGLGIFKSLCSTPSSLPLGHSLHFVKEKNGNFLFLFIVFAPRMLASALVRDQITLQRRSLWNTITTTMLISLVLSNDITSADVADLTGTCSVLLFLRWNVADVVFYFGDRWRAQPQYECMDVIYDVVVVVNTFLNVVGSAVVEKEKISNIRQFPRGRTDHQQEQWFKSKTYRSRPSSGILVLRI